MSSEGNVSDDGGEDRPSASSSGESTENKPGPPVIARTETSSTEFGNDLRIEVHALHRQSADVTILDFSMVNMGQERMTALTAPKSGDAAADFQPFSLLDGLNNTKHLPMLYSNGDCYCSDWQDTGIDPGNRIRAWMAFPSPPKGTASMALTSAIAPPILDIPVTNEGKNRKPSGEVAQPVIWNLRSIEDDLQAGSVREETGEEVAISLSTDVLFDVGKSKLDNQANKTLKQVANEVDDSSGTSVKIDGHTDNTGTDSVNNPLSLDRAKSVEQALSELVKKPGVEYESTGHGSDQPIATNETDEGKKKNRRVTITFKR
ncbi:OmpA family protein [Streptomonospora sediminis]